MGTADGNCCMQGSFRPFCLTVGGLQPTLPPSPWWPSPPPAVAWLELLTPPLSFGGSPPLSPPVGLQTPALSPPPSCGAPPPACPGPIKTRSVSHFLTFNSISGTQTMGFAPYLSDVFILLFFLPEHHSQSNQLCLHLHLLFPQLLLLLHRCPFRLLQLLQLGLVFLPDTLHPGHSV